MDKDLKDVLIYGAGTFFGYLGFVAFLLLFTSNFHLILIDTAILILFLWILFIQIKINKGGKSKK